MPPDARAPWPWSALDLQGPVPLREVKRAYALRLKAIDRTDPQAFQALQQAFEAAQAQALLGDDVSRPKNRPGVADLIPGQALRPDPTQGPGGGPFPTTSPHPVPDDPEGALPGLDPPRERRPVEHSGTGAARKAAGTGALPGLAADAPLTIPDVPHRPPAEVLRDITKLTAGTPWDVDTLARLLDDPVLHEDAASRAAAEALIFERLAAVMPREQLYLRPELARMLDREFGWASDGIRFRRRFGTHPRFRNIGFAVAVSRKSTLDWARDMAWRHDVLRRAAVLLGMGGCIALLMIALRSPERAAFRAGDLIWISVMLTPPLFMLGFLPIFFLVKARALPAALMPRRDSQRRPSLVPWVLGAVLGVGVLWGMAPGPERVAAREAMERVQRLTPEEIERLAAEYRQRQSRDTDDR